MGHDQKADGGNDVMLKDILAIPDPIKLQSPLPLLTTDEQVKRKLHDDYPVATDFAMAGDCYQL